MVATPQLNPLPNTSGLHLDALPPLTREAFLHCVSMPFFSSGEWYLAGGTALALQVGHRQSVDLDFFTPKKTFSEKEVEETLSMTGRWKTSSLSSGTIYGELFGAKISLIAYPFFKHSEPFLNVGTVSLVTPPDIAAMKITAVSQRGRKRDFVDLYWLSKNIQPLSESIERAQRNYTVNQNPNHILKSLVYFDDAESDPMPILLFDAKWEDIKEYFHNEVSRIAKKMLKLE